MEGDLQIINANLNQLKKSESSYEEVLNKLIPVVNHLLDTDMNALMNILYRIDVSEGKLKQVLSTTEPQLIGLKVSKLILDRQMEKIETRKKYKA